MCATFVAAAVQLTSSSDEAANWAGASELIARAARYGARFAATPENTNFLGPHEEKVRRAEPLDGPTAGRFGILAWRLGIYLLLGSFNERSDEAARCYNTSVLFGPDGSILGVYRKLHLFDVDIPGGVGFNESATCKPGDPDDPEKGTVVVETACGRIGLSICYDLRFPELYRRLADQGADVLTVPSAFTLATGKDHWEPLLRARAIENQCYLIAAAQHGRHDDGGLRESYGHAMIVDPWGLVLATASDGPGLALAEIDLERVQRVRRAIPVRLHRRLDSPVAAMPARV
ncbi:MAG TPA: carbon-nitrogen hydrolase family protein [Thermoanaerobaculia bacterium]|nr:carbon-nitrogen hydrolase family protein [Thermoanaerobaculia bacterium]